MTPSSILAVVGLRSSHGLAQCRLRLLASCGDSWKTLRGLSLDSLLWVALVFELLATGAHL